MTTTYSLTMNTKEIAAFNAHYHDITAIADTLSNVNRARFSLSHDIFMDFRQEMLLTAPDALLHRFDTLPAPSTDARLFLYSHFLGKLRNLSKKIRREQVQLQDESDIEKLPAPLPESDSEEAKYLVKAALKQANKQVKELCRQYMIHYSWRKCGIAMGLSTGKLGRLKEAAETLFRNFLKKRGTSTR